ncbi:hypothetical protein C0J52_10456 [Blattella germanica]|nr:hypothetical protein C0J52_10456 [Blattella germanica]
MPKELRNEFERIVKKGNKSLPGPEDLTLLGPLRKSYGANELQIEENAQRSISETLMATASTLKRPDVWKPLLILNTFFLFMQFSGVPVLIAYAVNIMMSEGVSLDPYFATLLLGIVKLVFEIVAGFVQNRYGRRPLSMISGLGMALCMVGLGLAHHFRAGGASWIPLLLIFAYVIAASVGFFLIPWAMLGEVYPTKVAGLACGITTCLGNLFGFASIKLFPTFVVAMGGTASGNSINAPEGVYYLYGGLTCLSVLFIALYLPETFQRSLQEISDDFKGPKRRLKCCSGD